MSSLSNPADFLPCIPDGFTAILTFPYVKWPILEKPEGAGLYSNPSSFSISSMYFWRSGLGTRI